MKHYDYEYHDNMQSAINACNKHPEWNVISVFNDGFGVNVVYYTNK